MKEVNKLKNEQLYIEMADIIRIGNQAITIAKEENKKLGILDMFWKNGKVYYVLTSGEVTDVAPAVLRG
ncbi:MAG: hypothetical protein R2788_17565 [Saprospiraceae bacterium]